MTSGFVDQRSANIVQTLAAHQIQIWNDRQTSKRRLYLKSQKIGVSTLCLLEDMHVALTYGRGREILIVAQSLERAKDHLQDLRKLILRSKWANLLIDRPMTDDQLAKDEGTKVGMIYLRNPDRPSSPTRIGALSITAIGNLGSWKKVMHIHCSDITFAEMLDERMYRAFGLLSSRLANTDGTMVVECAPRGPSGPVYDIVDADDTLKRDGVMVDLDAAGEQHVTPTGYLVRKYTYQVGIDAGMITPAFIEKEKLIHGVLFPMYYMADFYTSDKTWFNKEHIQQTSDEATDLFGVLA